jgi:hypothetical protein
VPLVNSPYSVFLDTNCLAGAYVSDLASEFPSARVIGIGREHALPSNTPPNSMFVVVENIAAGTSLASNSCHFVQSRDVSSFMKVENWKAYLHELYRILDAGGWIQVLEVSVWRQYPDDEGGGYQAWSQRLFPSLAAIKGVGLSNLDYWLLQWAKEIGFVDICPVRVQIPVGDWGNTQLRIFLQSFMCANSSSSQLNRGREASTAESIGSCGC